jgi:hypothetical protein
MAAIETVMNTRITNLTTTITTRGITRQFLPITSSFQHLIPSEAAPLQVYGSQVTVTIALAPIWGKSALIARFRTVTI